MNNKIIIYKYRELELPLKVYRIKKPPLNLLIQANLQNTMYNQVTGKRYRCSMLNLYKDNVGGD